jgi:signal transduction histidine kinase
VEPRERASLGRTAPWLRAIGLAIWAFVGASHTTAGQLSPWLVYGAAFVVASVWRRAPYGASVGLLAVQAVAVFFMPRFGFGGSEGVLLAVVAAQAPAVLSFRGSVLWAVVQAVLLLATVYPFKRSVEIVEILGAYSSFAAFALLVYWLHLRERRARRELADANAALVASQALLVEGSRQGERLRISRELHDSLGHHLTALGMQLELAHQLAEGPAAEPVARARTLSRDSLGEVRRVVSAMQDSIGMDLVSALRALAGGIRAPRISVEASDDLPVALTDEARHALFRCVQEAITNSVKHSSAQNVWVRVTPSSGGLEVLVQDDGDGVGQIVPGRGLEGMRARAAHVGGRATFESGAGRGFAVRITVPR